MNINIPPKINPKQVPEQSSKFLNSIFKTPKESVKESVKNSVESVKDVSKNLYQNSVKKIDEISTSPLALIGLIILVILAIIIAYVMYSYVEKSLFNQSKYIVEQTKLPIICSKKTEISLDRKITSIGNGLKRTYTFWIYIKDNNQNQFRNVMYIGNDRINERGPTIFLDKRGNKMFVRFDKRTSEEENDNKYQFTANSVDNVAIGSGNHDYKYINDLMSANAQPIGQDYNNNLIQFMRQGIVIPYIPIQRWVHVGIVVNDYGNENGGSIAGYVDGELVAEALHGDKMKSLGKAGEDVTYDINNLNLERSNKLVTGGDGTGFPGLISKVTIYNYDLNDRDIYNDYADGPIDNFLAKLGLGAYGLRSPVYRIS